jgi:hypothetical protein
MVPTTPASPTIGAALARIRLERRAARLEALLSMLRLRAVECSAMSRPVPGPLSLAIADFHEELSGIRRSLGPLA